MSNVGIHEQKEVSIYTPFITNSTCTMKMSLLQLLARMVGFSSNLHRTPNSSYLLFIAPLLHNIRAWRVPPEMKFIQGNRRDLGRGRSQLCTDSASLLRMIDCCTKLSKATHLPFKHALLDLRLLTVSVPIKIQLKFLNVRAPPLQQK